MKKVLIKLFIGLFAFFGGIIYYGDVYADDSVSTSIMSVSPMYQKLVLTPGERYTGAIKVSNPNSADNNLNYKVSIGSFSQRGDGKSKDDYAEMDTISETNYNMIMNWITIDNEVGSVPKNETNVISFTIDVPEDAPAGGQYASLLVRDTTPRNSSNNGNISIESNVEIVSIIYAEVTGDTREEGDVLENSIPGFLFNGPLEATSLVRNNGNVHTDAKYTLQVWPMFSNEEICTNEENVTEVLIMPETQLYHEEKCNLPAVGIFRAKQTVEIFGTKSETSEKLVIVCPLWLLFIIIFAIAALITFIFAKMRGKKK